MGVRTLVGEYDGTTPAAVMVDSTSGWPVGPIFEGDEAFEQIEAFQDWLRREPWLRGDVLAEIGLRHDDIPGPLARSDDPRSWPPTGLSRLVAYWRANLLVDGHLPEPVEG